MSRIIDLPATSSVSSDDALVVVQSNETRQVTLSVLTAPIDASVDKVNKALGEEPVNAEPRFLHEITVGGSPDYFYPFIFRFGRGIISKMTIVKHYSWSSDVIGSAGLLLEIEGHEYGWSGNPLHFKVNKYGSTYEPKLVSHVQFHAKCDNISNDGNPLQYVYGGGHAMPRYSSLYLRGGQRFAVHANWGVDFIRLDNEDDINDSKVVLSHLNTDFVIKPIAYSELQEPIED